MRNFLQNGDAIYVPAPTGGVVSGQPVMIGKLLGVASEDAAQGVTLALWLKGVYSLPKTSAQAWAVGDVLYWDGTSSLTNVNTGSLVPCGYAVEVAANPSSVGKALLGRVPA